MLELMLTLVGGLVVLVVVAGLILIPLGVVFSLVACLLRAVGWIVGGVLGAGALLIAVPVIVCVAAAVVFSALLSLAQALAPFAIVAAVIYVLVRSAKPRQNASLVTT